MMKGCSRLRQFVMGSMASVGILLVAAGCQSTEKAPVRSDGIRAIWVTRWDFKTEDDVKRIMRESKNSGFNTVLFQVRGNGTVQYRSPFEPWSVEFNGRDPGFDPLSVACREAHKRGLSLHAWVNVMPGWRGKEPPTDPRQLYRARADWFWRDANGHRQPLGWYNSVNPCYPEVRRYLTDVIGDIVARYEVDGIHLDYIRFPNEWNDSYPKGAVVPDYPRDPRTIDMFRQATGQTPDSAPGVWKQWRADQVTQLVRQIRSRIKRMEPQVKLSAAVGAVPDRSREAYFQDSVQWMRENLLDAVYPMNYAADLPMYDQQLDIWQRLRPRIPVVMGIMFVDRTPDLVKSQIASTSRTGAHFAAFAYNGLFERRDLAGKKLNDGSSASRAALRRYVLPIIRRQKQDGFQMAQR
ncbi:MAG: glycoside hydrolase family 10 protein [Phycisphaerae bacterium]